MSEQTVAQPEDLYGLPLDQFTAARDRLAKRLRSDGDDATAAAVAKLRKPSVAAWALNIASRQSPEAVERLMASHRRLRETTTADMLQEASRDRRSAVAELLETAVDALAAEGRPASGTTRDRINSTLLATGTDHEAESDLAAGRLVREVEPSGAGWGDIALTPPPRDTKTREKLAAEQARAKAEKLKSEAEKAEQRAERALEALTEATRRAEEAREVADRAESEAREAERAAI